MNEYCINSLDTQAWRQAVKRSSEELDSGEVLCRRCNFTDDDIVEIEKEGREDEEKERRGSEMKFEADESC